MNQQPAITALPAKYAGTRYRSRMEARWAVFMDHMGIKFEYESEGFELGGVCYLPDFYIPKLDVFMEIKNPLAENGGRKPKILAEKSGKNVYLFVSNPATPNWDDYDREGATCYFSDGGIDHHFLWCECSTGRHVGIEFDGRSDRIGCGCPISDHGDKGYNYDTERLRKCYNISSAWRFD